MKVHRDRHFNREDEALADKKIEEEAQAIIQGERRIRKKHGSFLDEDDSDDEGNANDIERLHRKLRKMKKREDVEALGMSIICSFEINVTDQVVCSEHNPQTKSFAATYNATLVDDNDDFQYLEADHTQDILNRLTVPQTGEEEGDDEEEPVDEDEESQSRSMDISEFQRIIRERRITHGNLDVRCFDACSLRFVLIV